MCSQTKKHGDIKMNEEYTVNQLCSDIRDEIHCSNKDDFYVNMYHDNDKNIMYVIFEVRKDAILNDEYVLDTPFLVAYVDLNIGEYHRCHTFKDSVLNYNIDFAFEMYCVNKSVSKNSH